MPINLYNRYFKNNQQNELIIQKFTELLEAIEIEKLMCDSKEEKRRHDFRLFSIRRGLNRIRQIPEPIIHGESLQHFYGIGDGIINRINEILLTGNLSELESIKANHMVKAVLELKTVHGLGETLAKDLYLNHHITSVKQLKDRVQADTIVVNSIVKLGLLYYDDIISRIPRQEIKDTYEFIQEILFQKDSEIISECCGSYRRGKETSGDIDIIISHRDIITEHDLITRGGSVLSYLITQLQSLGMLEVTLNAGLSRFQGLIRTVEPYNRVRRADIFWVPYDSYYSGLAYLTGSDIFNRLCRCIAHKKGYTMSNWGLYPFIDQDKKRIGQIKRNKAEEPDINFDTVRNDPHAPKKYLTGSKILLRSEQEIFRILEIEWLPPEQRK